MIHDMIDADNVALPMDLPRQTGPTRPHPAEVDGIAADSLKRYVDRLERLVLERKGIGAQIRELLRGAKATGFDPAVIRRIVTARGDAKRDRTPELLRLYRAAVSMFSPPPR